MKLLGGIFFAIGTIFLCIGLSIFYFLDEGSEITQWEVYLGPSIFSLIGFIFAAIGGGLLLSVRRERLRRELLTRTGRKIEASVTDISMNTKIRINNRHPYVIECTADVSGKEKVFKSSNIYGSLLLNRGDKLHVYLDFRNYNNYWVEVPKEALRS